MSCSPEPKEHAAVGALNGRRQTEQFTHFGFGGPIAVPGLPEFRHLRLGDGTQRRERRQGRAGQHARVSPRAPAADDRAEGPGCASHPVRRLVSRILWEWLAECMRSAHDARHRRARQTRRCCQRSGGMDLNACELEIDLFCRGMRIPPDVSLAGARGVSRTRAGLGSGLEVILPTESRIKEEIWLNIPVLEAFASESP